MVRTKELYVFTIELSLSLPISSGVSSQWVGNMLVYAQATYNGVLRLGVVTRYVTFVFLALRAEKKKRLSIKNKFVYTTEHGQPSNSQIYQF